MKHLLYTQLGILFIFSINLNAQISITSTDMPIAGDTIRTSIAANTTGFDFEQTGANYTWDYRSLIPVSQRLDTFKTVTQTPVYFWPSFLKSANLATRFNASELLPGFVFEDAYRFYSNTAASFRDFGFGLIVSGLPLPLKFSSPDVLYTFPMTMGSNFSSDAFLEFSLADMGYISIQRERQNEVDGWGNLQTPYGNFDVIRLKSVVHEIDSVYLDTVSQGIRVERNYIEYKWMAKNQDIPLLHCTVDSDLGTNVVYRDSIRDLTVAINEVKMKEALLIYPNPAFDKIHFNFCSDKRNVAKILIVKLQGATVFEQNDFKLFQGCNTYQLELLPSQFQNGTYFLIVQTNNTSQSNKFVISKP